MPVDLDRAYRGLHNHPSSTHAVDRAAIERHALFTDAWDVSSAFCKEQHLGFSKRLPLFPFSLTPARRLLQA